MKQFAIATVLVLAAISISVVGADLWIQAQPSSRISIEDYAKKLGNAFDSRSREEFIRDLAKLEGSAFTGPAGRHILVTDGNGNLRSPLRLNLEQSTNQSRRDNNAVLDDREVLPFAGLSNVPTVFCNETGQWIWYRSDEQGFRNPRGAWQAPVDFLALGDSYVHGFCVPDGTGMVDVIREAAPRTVNLAIAGLGQLSMLALLREFGPVLRPKTVLWFFYSNDVTDIGEELRSPLLRRYLEGQGPLQDLFLNKTKIDEKMREIYEERALQTRNTTVGPLTISIRNALLARTVRHRLGLSFGQTTYDFEMFERILRIAKDEAARWQGQVVFIYLPEAPLFTADLLARRYVQDIRANMNRIAGEVGLRQIDLVAAFESVAQPLTLFDEPSAHYSEKGTKLAGSVLVRQLGLHHNKQ